MFKRLLKNRKGTAEVIGSVMFIVILLFFFTNVYVWHDAGTKQVDEMHVKKMNAGMSISYGDGQLIVSATSSDVTLSRLWIDSSNIHVYADLEMPHTVQLKTGDTNAIIFAFASGPVSNGAVSTNRQDVNHITVNYAVPSGPVRFTIVNTLGIAVTTQYTPT